MSTAKGIVVIVSGSSIFFVQASTSSVIRTQSVTGTLSADVLIWNSLAFCAENLSTGSNLYAFDLSQPSAPTLWTLNVPGQVNCTPVVASGHVWFANSEGSLLGVPLNGSSSPSLVSFDAMQLVGATATVRYLVTYDSGQRVVMFSDRGVYAIDLSGALRLLWSALGGLDLTAVPPLNIEGTLLCVNGNTVWTLSTGAFGLANQASITLSESIHVLLPYNVPLFIVGLESGEFQILNVTTSQSVATFDLALSTQAVGWTRRCGNILISFDPGGAISTTTLAVDSAGSVTTSSWWTPAATQGLTGPPTVSSTLAVGISTDGKLFLYDVASKSTSINGTSLTGHVTSSAAAYSPSLESNTTGQIRFLLDGEEFFPALRDVMIAVSQGSFAPPTTLPSDLTFEGLIKAIGAANHSAFVMVWNTPIAYSLTDAGQNWTTFQIAKTMGAIKFASIFDPNGAVRGDQRLNAQTEIALSNVNNVSVYLETYETADNTWSPIELGSNHQKIVIASVAGSKVAFVSGFNTKTPSYYDTTKHTLENDQCVYTGKSWHDTGLIITGPAVEQIEAEFDRRWSKQGSKPSPTDSSYIKFANWMISRDSVLGPATSPPAYSNPLPNTPAVPLQVAITSNETFSEDTQGLRNPGALLTGVHQILDRLLLEINKASSYIYLENFTFTSLELTKAIAERLQDVQQLQVIIMVPHPTVDEYNGEFSIGDQNKLIRFAYAALKIASKDWSYLTLSNGNQISPTDSPRLQFNGREISNTTLTFTKGASTRTVSLREVLSITEGNGPPQVVFCSPARYFTTPPADSGNQLQGKPANFRAIYIHSKLGIFDNKVAFIGSCNLSQRSLRADGEMTVFIEDSTQTVNIRDHLFGHWNMNTEVDWVSKMNAYAIATNPKVGILPLEYGAFRDKPVTYTWSLITTIVDPSQLL